MIKKLTWLKTYFSPFKPIKPIFYIGKLRYGTPIFFPRKWIKDKEKPGYLKAIPKKIGFDIVGLGWKTKWDEHDYRFEWNPIWSFVFFKWQIAIIFNEPVFHYWECWLAYELSTDKTKSPKERIEQAKEVFPCIWSSFYPDGSKEKICYWDKILKKKYL